MSVYLDSTWKIKWELDLIHEKELYKKILKRIKSGK